MSQVGFPIIHKILALIVFPYACYVAQHSSLLPRVNFKPNAQTSQPYQHISTFFEFPSLSVSMTPALSPANWARKSASGLLSLVSFIVFLLLDFLETIFCAIYRYLDEFFEGKATPCYCESRGEQTRNVFGADESELSETLYGRKNVFRQLGFLEFAKKWEDGMQSGSGGGGGGGMVNRWSDCGCESCVSWIKDGGESLHVVVREPSKASNDDCNGNSTENVIFLHGFLSSSSLWTETVFRNLSEPAKRNYRLFAVDLLGFGRSPKPRDCLYTLRDHLERIEKSVISPYELKSFHFVAHSMGCVIALALAAKHLKFVKSITLLAPPYFPASKDGASLTVLNRLAKRKLWPPLLFGSSFMSWYEHLGRCICLVVCRNHRTWERVLKLITWKRDLHFMTVDLTRHTHHSAWHSMHNVICGGGKLMDGYLETLMKSEAKICVVQGDQDEVVPLECSNNIKIKVPSAEVNVIANADHCSVICGRDKDFTLSLEHIWASCA